MNTPESIKHTPEHQSNNEAIEKAGMERRERLKEELAERAGEKSHETGAEDAARHEALDSAMSAHERPQEQEGRQPSPAERRTGPISKADRDASFNATMHEVQSQMSTSSRAFSKVIHSKGIEKTSEVAASTIARPNALLSGAVFAFILTLAVYIVAKNIGYPLSGFESIGAFLLGWVLGLVYDFLKTMITGRK